MSITDEKECLKAVLEGKIKPGDLSWKRIWKEKDFARVREALRNVGMMERSDAKFDRDKMWRMIEEYRGEVSLQREKRWGWRWVAAIVIPLMMGGVMWFSLRDIKKESLSQTLVLEGGKSQAVLILSEGERVDLSSVQADTLLDKGNVHIRLDSSRNVTYERKNESFSKVEYNTIIVPRKGEYRLTLADGTKVYLNSESEIRFPTFFEGEERKVFLKGEAFFDVTPNEKQPFVVEVGEIDVRVLGTRFNVNAYSPKQVIRTTLVSGKVQVKDRSDHTSAILEPGQQAVWSEGAFSMYTVDALAVSAWIDGKFYFENGATLEEIAEQLKRWYDIDFFFVSDRVKHFVFAGVIKKEYTANEIFSIIEKTTRVKFTVKGRDVFVDELKK